MSSWTHITGWIKVFPLGRTQEEKEYILRSVLNHLPCVEGSERDMYTHVVVAGGKNSFSSHDEYDEMTNNLVDCYGNKTRYKGWIATQDYYYLLVEGDLRDTILSETYRQFIKWVIRLAKRVEIINMDIVVSDDCDKSLRISETKCYNNSFADLWELPSWIDWEAKKYIAPYQDYDYNWCEHLLWWTNLTNE